MVNGYWLLVKQLSAISPPRRIRIQQNVLTDSVGAITPHALSFNVAFQLDNLMTFYSQSVVPCALCVEPYASCRMPQASYFSLVSSRSQMLRIKFRILADSLSQYV